MLGVHSFRQTSRYFILNATRSSFSTVRQAKQTESNPTNVDQLNTTARKIGDYEAIPSNDLLEAKRTIRDEKNDPALVVTSTEKFVTGFSPLQPTSSLTPTGHGLFQDAKAFNTSISPGTPVVPSKTPIIEEDSPKKDDQIPSSGFSAFLRGISSGLPLFPSRKNRSSPVNITTTREYFLPLTRPSIIRLLATDSQFIDDEEDRTLFHELCQGFDSAVVQHYYPILNELKHLFNPLNPDDETLDNRRISYRDRLDNEYWLLQKINDLLHRANFTELPRQVFLDKFLLHQDSVLSSNLNVKIDGHDYDVLKYWILGREHMPIEMKSWWKRLFRIGHSATSRDYFKRVVIAIRLKGHDRLYIKAFRDIPLANLTQLLPTGKLQIGNFEQQLVRLTILLGASTTVTHLLTKMADYHVPGLILSGSSLTLLLGLWSVSSFYRSKINYLATMNRMLFYKNIASNKQLLAMIVDRAEDELSKEILLVYMFILQKQQKNTDLTKKNLELEIENWVRLKSNAHITFNSTQAIEFLRKIGILLPDDISRPNHLQVLPLKQVVRVLPKASRTLSEKTEEWDLVEGYDKKYFELDWKTVLNEEKLLNKGGWQ
ncbi:unnamed protein product [Adineta ricciae]|uniref:Uncharacterized protein n=1 Tax=Adineta ricciae TaxID=249248 RepID=A0A813QSQ3_ADIRI|nr:unnamed protein product [Adineta ricciae]CAF0784024.1 unnamed protein product [Adineta ricciae]